MTRPTVKQLLARRATAPQPSEPPADAATGWRAWLLLHGTRIVSLGGQPGAGEWDPHGTDPATCQYPPEWAEPHPPWPHDPPAPGCTCGIRAMVDLGAMLGGYLNEPRRFGFGRHRWQRYPDVYAFRAEHGALDVPDIIGQVRYWGRTLPGSDICDPPGTIRAEHAQLGRVLHLGRWYATEATDIAARYRVEVRVGKATGLDWLYEIAEAEGIDL